MGKKYTTEERKVMSLPKKIITSHFGRILIAFVWMATWIGISNVTSGTWAFWIAMLGVGYLVGLTLVMIAYAWVINPIRERKEIKAEREKYNK